MAATFLRPPDLSKEVEKKSPSTDAELKARITQLDETERKLGYWAAGIGAVVAVVAIYPYISNPKRSILLTQALGHNHTCSKGYVVKRINGTLQCASELVHPRTDWVLELAVLLLFCVGMFLATRFNRRSALGFAALMTGLAFETVLSELGGWGLLGLPLLFFGGWLIVRAWRAQKYGTTSAKEAAQAAAEQRAEKKAARQGGAAPSTTRSTKAKSTAKGSTTTSTRSTPAASKRYTPKSPPKKKTTRSS